MYSRRKVVVGTVVSDKDRKFRVVEERARVIGHPLYKKSVEKTRKFHVSDLKEISKIGDSVRIQECKPVSKTIRWKILGIISSGKGKESDAD